VAGMPYFMHFFISIVPYQRLVLKHLKEKTDKNQTFCCISKKHFICLQCSKRETDFTTMKVNNLYTTLFESFAGNFFGFWFYFFYSLKNFRD
jgi:hypothetical protein